MYTIEESLAVAYDVHDMFLRTERQRNYLKRELELHSEQSTAYYNDFLKVASAMREGAITNDLCEEYENTITWLQENLESDFKFDFIEAAKRTRRFRVTFTATAVEYVEARSESQAIRNARDMEHDWLENYYDTSAEAAD